MESIGTDRGDDVARVAQRKAMGQRIAALRMREGMSQPELAEAAGIAQPSLSTIESGKTVEVSARTLISLCRALRTTIEYVWEGDASRDAQDEAELLAIYRKLQPPWRVAVLQSARAFLSTAPQDHAPGVRLAAALPPEVDESRVKHLRVDGPAKRPSTSRKRKT